MRETLRNTGFIFPNKLEGWLSPNEGSLLYQLAQRNKELGVVVELGSYHGKSTICLAQGAQNANDGKIYAVDAFQGNRYTSAGDFLPKFMQSITSFGVKDFVAPVRGDFTEVSRTWDKPIRLLFIDGSHQYEEVKRDFNVWERHVSAGGVVAFHDSLTHPGVAQVIAEALGSRKFNQCETLDSKSGLTYMVKAKPDDIVSDSDVQGSIDKLNFLARKKVLPRLASNIGARIPLLNPRFL